MAAVWSLRASIALSNATLIFSKTAWLLLLANMENDKTLVFSGRTCCVKSIFCAWFSSSSGLDGDTESKSMFFQTWLEKDPDTITEGCLTWLLSNLNSSADSLENLMECSKVEFVKAGDTGTTTATLITDPSL